MRTTTRLMLSTLVSSLSLMFSPAAAHAMDFGVRSIIEREGKLLTILSATGEIRSGDDAKLHRFVAGLPVSTQVMGIVVNSGGGVVDEAVMLGSTISKSSLSVGVDGLCASACFLLLAAGHERYAFNAARIGVHSASVAGNETDYALLYTIKMARQVAGMGIPPTVVGKMVTTPGSKMAWLSDDDLREMGVRIVADPTEMITYVPGGVLKPGTAPAAPTPITRPETSGG